MNARKIVILVSVLVIAAMGIWAVSYHYAHNSLTYDGSLDVVQFYEDYEEAVKEAEEQGLTGDEYDEAVLAAIGAEDAQINGIADAIIEENLVKTEAANDVASIVFDFRGFDTLGESFILLTAIAGSFVILSVHKKKKAGKEETRQ